MRERLFLPSFSSFSAFLKCLAFAKHCLSHCLSHFPSLSTTQGYKATTTAHVTPHQLLAMARQVACQAHFQTTLSVLPVCHYQLCFCSLTINVINHDVETSDRRIDDAMLLLLPCCLFLFCRCLVPFSFCYFPSFQ